MTECREGYVGQVRATEAGTYVFPLSSEAPVRRYDSVEILDHSEGAVNLDWLNSGNAPVLDTHNRYDGLRAQIGAVTRAWLENKRVYVEMKFSNRPEAQAFKQDVDEGIIRNVSVGYDVNKVLRSEDSEEYRVIEWTPKEASFVPIPAAMTVGMGRSQQHKEAVMADVKDKPTLPGLDVNVQTEEQRAEAMNTAVE